MSWTAGSSTIAEPLCLQHLRGARLEWGSTITPRVLAAVMVMVATTGTVDDTPTRLMVAIATLQAIAEDRLGLGTETETAIGIATRPLIRGCRPDHRPLRMAGTTGLTSGIIVIGALGVALPSPDPTSTPIFRATG